MTATFKWIFGLFVVSLMLPLFASNKQPVAGTLISLDGNEWFIGIDPKNIGRDEQWWDKPTVDARQTKVPWVIQAVFPDYHGVAWYWRSFVAPISPDQEGRYLLRFWAVDYKADVWLNGTLVGGHEGGETPFILDVTKAIRPGKTNMIAVRVLNPGEERIDGIVLAEVPHRNKTAAFSSGADYDHGGIEDSVELFTSPAVRVADLYVHANPATSIISADTDFRNASLFSRKVVIDYTVAPSAGGQTIQTKEETVTLKAGDTVLKEEFKLNHSHLWGLDDPYLYRVTVKIRAALAESFDEQSTRCGFRDFRFENNYFRLNGRRILLRSTVSGDMFPIGIHVPPNDDWPRRDLINVKMMGFNAIRFYGLPTRRQLDLCDELGLMVYEESYSSQLYTVSPQMAARFDQSTTEMILRDRNHPSIVLWGLLNETGESAQFRHAVKALPLVRSFDESRAVMLSSGRFDAELGIGSICNPESQEWECLLGNETPGGSKSHATSVPAYIEKMGDVHVYPWVPHTAKEITFLRELGRTTKPVFISEYGICSGIDLPRVVRQYEQRGAGESGEAKFHRQALEKFMVDWNRWKMAECFGEPEEFFSQSLTAMARERWLGLNAIRSNPQVAGFDITGTTDQGYSGEGLVTSFRELKAGTTDALFDSLALLRWCLFAEPVNVYEGGKLRIEAVLANEDVLSAGDYPARFDILGPNNEEVFSETTNVHITGGEQPFALPVFSKEIAANWPAGEYRLVASFEKNAAATGRETSFYVTEPVKEVGLRTPVTLWGQDEKLRTWLVHRGVEVRNFNPEEQTNRELILVGSVAASPGGADVFKELAAHVARGSSVVFLDPNVFSIGGSQASLELIGLKGSLIKLPNNVYHKDDWSKRHPIFDGVPSGGLMDYTFYRQIISNVGWARLDAPMETVAGAMMTFTGYISGVLVSVDQLGAGKVVLNCLSLRENLGIDPAADRLLANMLRFAQPDAAKNVDSLPDNFEARFKRE